MQEVAEQTLPAAPTRTVRKSPDFTRPARREPEKRLKIHVVREEPCAATPKVDPLRTEVNGLLPQLRRGDRQAQGTFARLAFRPLWRLLMTKGLDPDRAEELAQDVMLRVLKNVDDITTNNLWGYATQAAVNAAIDETRMERARNTHTATEEFENKNGASPERLLEIAVGSDGARQVEDEALHNVNRAEILRAISSLPQGYQSVMKLLAKGYRPSEIAQILNIKPGAVSKRIYDARRLLRKMTGHTSLSK